MVLILVGKSSDVVTPWPSTKPANISSFSSGICCQCFSRYSSAGEQSFSTGVGGLPRMRVGIYALRQQEKLLMFSRYLDEIPNNRQNRF